MKKTLSYILITFIILANVLAPISVSWGTKSGPQIKQNKAEAADSQIKLTTYTTRNDTSIRVNFNVTWISKKIGDKSFVYIELWKFTASGIAKLIASKQKKTVLTGEMTTTTTTPFLSQEGSVLLNKLTANTAYAIQITATQINSKGTTVSSFQPINNLYIRTLPKGTTDFSDKGIKSNETNNSNLPVCVSGVASVHVGGCIAQALYYGLFVPSSFLFALAGTFFDYTFAYSINSSSYKSAFVTQGWGLVRDFVDMFFIFILLYIAFGTILNLNGVKTKEMIINVIIIGLLINFSLFAVKVIIDTSNVLARVFYNSDAINITQVAGPDASTVFRKEFKKEAASGVLPLSMALVNKVNPQSLIINANQVGTIPNDNNTDTTSRGITTGTFIIVTILAAGISLVGFIVFLSVGLIFIVRVVGLWLAMILAPFAFFSYTVPAMQNMEMVGWKKWWPQVLSLAFLAPVFIFFLYLILQFLQTGLGVLDASSKSKASLAFLISVFVPFAFIMVLLMKAKSIAVKMSGDMGKAVAKAGSAVGGMALGAVTGGASLAMRSTIGRKANNIANSEKLKEASQKGGFTGWQAKMRLKTAGSLSKSSFDARKTQFGKWADKSLETNMSGGPSFIKPKEGGFKGAQERKVKRKLEEAKLIELSPVAAAKQNKDAKDDKTGKTLTADQENQRRRREYAKTIGTSSDVGALVSSELTKGQLSEKETEKAEKSLKTTKVELIDINAQLGIIATGLGKKAEEITQSDITNLLKKPGGKEEQFSAKEAEIIKWTAVLQEEPKNSSALTELTRVNMEKNRLKNEIAETKSLLNNKETYTNRESQLKEKLKSK